MQSDNETSDISIVNENLTELESNMIVCESNVTIDECNVKNNSAGNATNKECNVTSKAGNVTLNEHNVARLHTDFSSLKISVEKLGLNLASGSLDSFLQETNSIAFLIFFLYFFFFDKNILHWSHKLWIGRRHLSNLDYMMLTANSFTSTMKFNLFK